jgi:hypothetical protein|tara:strand:- start:1609 stop:1791 length:183 start_codon:yes stop_codon:yes gene_type:complete
MDRQLLYSIKEAAQIVRGKATLGTIEQIKKLVKSGHLKPVVIGKRNFIPADQLEKLTRPS